MNSIALLLLCMTFISSVTAQCSDQDVRNCVSIVHRHLLAGGRNVSQEVLINVCRDLTPGENCIKNLTCPERDAKVLTLWQGTRDAFTYVCNDHSARDVLVNNQCVKSAAVNSAFVACEAQFNREYRPDDPTTACSPSKTLLKCYEEALRTCGNRVIRYYITSQYKLLKPPTTLDSGCVFDEPVFGAESTATQSATPAIPLLFPVFVYFLSQ
jgi:hypothetical protein